MSLEVDRVIEVGEGVADVQGEVGGAPDISCGHRVSAIKKAVSALPGVSKVEWDPGTK